MFLTVKSDTFVTAFQMANLKFEPKHNIVALLKEDIEEADGYGEMIRFLLRSKYAYALCAKPVIYKRLINRFWRTAHTMVNEDVQKVVRGSITAQHELTVSEESIREALRLGDNDPEDLDEFNLEECRECFIQMGHPNVFPKQQFVRARLFKHWKLLCYVIQHCMSRRSAGFDTFPYTVASPIVALAMNRRFNMAKWILNGFVFNLEKGSRYKFMMYPRFLQLIINQAYPWIREDGLFSDRYLTEDMSELTYEN